MGKSIGIDLGTTNTVAAISEGTECRVLRSRGNNERYMPSVVGLHMRTGEELVGGTALDNAGANPENTIISVKRLMGRYYDDPDVQRAREHYAYRIVKAADGSADARVMLGDKELTPTEISARILRRIKEDAESRLGEEVTHAVITVPAYFSMLQRICTRDAGEMAGLRVKAIIDEPSAAAIAFGVEQKSEEPKTVLVFDMGGGTFDVSVLNLVSDHAFTQMNIEGNIWLGGDDFDQEIVEEIVTSLERTHKRKLTLGPTERFLLKQWAEKAKIQLSEMAATTILQMSAIPDGQGARLDVELDLTRTRFETLVRAKAVDGAMDLVRLALRNAEISPDRIDHVLLVGGSSTIPVVQEALDREFGKERVLRSLDPMTCVAIGAAIMAERLEGCLCVDVKCQHFNPPNAAVCEGCSQPLRPGRICNGCQARNEPDAVRCSGCGRPLGPTIPRGGVLAKAIGIGVKEDGYEIILPKNTPYPILEPVVHRYQTAEATQKRVGIPIYHGEDLSSASKNEWIGHVNVDVAGDHLPARTPVSLSIQMNADGILEIEATIQDGSGRKRTAKIDPQTPQLISEPIMDSGGELPAVGPPRWERDLGWSVAFARLIVSRYEWLLDHRKTQRLRTLAEEGEEILHRHDEAAGRTKEAQIDQFAREALGGIWDVPYAEMQCHSRQVDPVLENEVRAKAKQIIEMIRRNASPETTRAELARLRELTLRVISETQAPQDSSEPPGGAPLEKP